MGGKTVKVVGAITAPARRGGSGSPGPRPAQEVKKASRSRRSVVVGEGESGVRDVRLVGGEGGEGAQGGIALQEGLLGGGEE